MTDHPITPPPELVKQWIDDYYGCPVSGEPDGVEIAIAINAAQYGADQELEACCKIALTDPVCGTIQRSMLVRHIREQRRGVPSLKDQALGAMGRFTTNAHTHADQMLRDFDIIRRALEELE